MTTETNTGDTPPANDPKPSSLGDVLSNPSGNPNDDVPPPEDGAFDMAHLDETLRGADANEALPKVWGELKRARETLAAQGAKPERAEEYGLTLSDTAKAFFPDVENDPFVAITREVALEAGLTKTAFEGFIPKLLEKFSESGLLDDPIDPQKEAEKLGEGGRAKYGEAVGFIERLKARLPELGDGEKAEMEDAIGEAELLLGTASGVRLLNVAARLGGETGAGRPSGEAAPKITAETISQMRRDPRYDPDDAKYDAAYRKRVDQQAKEFYGEA